MSKFAAIPLALVVSMVALATPAAAQYRNEIDNNPKNCNSGSSVKVVVRGIKASTGNVRLNSYRATKAEWLKKGRWLSRIEMPAKAGTMTFCMPVPGPGNYAFAVRHDVNGNGETDVAADGGAMSGNPSINIFNLGKPSVTKTTFAVGDSPTSITVNMRYM